MSSDWKTAPLGELALNISKPFKFKGRSSVVFINTGDILSGEFLHRTATSPQGLPGQAKKAISNGDILYSEIRPGNKRHLLVNEDNPDDFVVSTKFMIIKPKGDVSPEYLYLVLTNNDCEKEFKVIADSRSGTFPQITFDSISYYPIRYPNPELQKRIVEFDSALTRKIRVNKKINQTLEQIAQAIFKSWFVDFEPVKAKISALEAGGSEEDALLAAMQAISGKDAAQLAQLQAEYPDQYTELRTTAELFPSAMQDSELGEIPTGWEVGSLTQFGKIICGKTPSKKSPHYFGGSIPFIKIPDMHTNVFATSTSDYLSLEGANSQKSKQIPAGAICVSCIATVGKVVITTELSHTNQQINSIVPNHPRLTSYLYFGMKNLNKLLHDLASGGSATLNLNTSSFSKIEIIMPPESVLNSYSKTVAPLFSTILNNVHSIHSLSSTRDTLLPKLLNGELKLQESSR